MQWEYLDYSGPHPRDDNANRGIVLVVGYLPGMKVDAIPFFHSKRVSFISLTQRGYATQQARVNIYLILIFFLIFKFFSLFLQFFI